MFFFYVLCFYAFMLFFLHNLMLIPFESFFFCCCCSFSQIEFFYVFWVLSGGLWKIPLHFPRNTNWTQRKMIDRTHISYPFHNSHTNPSSINIYDYLSLSLSHLPTYSMLNFSLLLPSSVLYNLKYNILFVGKS